MFIKRSGLLFNEAQVPDAGAGAAGGGAAGSQAGATGATGTTGATATAGATAGTVPEQDPEWFKNRLGQAKKTAEKELLKSFGFEKPEDAKAALDRLKALDAEKLTAEERNAAKLKELEPQAARAATLETTLKGYAEKEFGELSDEQKAAVTRLAGEDPAKVLDTIATLRPTWAAKAAAAAGATGAASTETQGASTTSAGKQPAGTSTTSGVDHKAEYQRLKTTNPILAAEYRQAHGKELNGG